MKSENLQLAKSPTEEVSPDSLSSLSPYNDSKVVTGFDRPDKHSETSGIPACKDDKKYEVSMIKHALQVESEEQNLLTFGSTVCPFGVHNKQIIMVDQAESSEPERNQNQKPFSSTVDDKQEKFCSHLKPTVSSYVTAENEVPNLLDNNTKIQTINHLRDRSFDPFKTWSGKLERQLSNFRGRYQEPDLEAGGSQTHETEVAPVQRYFDALEGPELDILRESEVSVLPQDRKWPFLLRFPVSTFSICLGISSQAILWKALATSPTMSFLHINLTVNLVLWCMSLALLSIIAFTYILKIIFYFEAVRREFTHPIRLNFFFSPWIACLFLALGIPPSVAKTLPPALWYVLMTPIFCLELKIYGQWMSGGQYKLSKVANPSNHLTIVGNFVGALLGASMGLKEGPIFFFAVGLAHYIVLFVTLYQRLPTTETFPRELHPVFFLFVAAPSVTSMAWEKINGEFDSASRIFYFVALFLYISLAVRINFFRGYRFSIAWWAYTFPMTGAAIATIKYSNEMTNVLTKSLAVVLSAISTFTVTFLLILTVIHAFILHDLFPNDISIAITKKRPKSKFLTRLKTESSDLKELEMYTNNGILTF